VLRRIDRTRCRATSAGSPGRNGKRYFVELAHTLDRNAVDTPREHKEFTLIERRLFTVIGAPSPPK
jgi:hypothetical protein